VKVQRAVFLALFWLFPVLASAAPVDEVRASMYAVARAQEAYDGGSAKDPGLTDEIVKLTRLLNGSELDEGSQTTARYYRARASMLINHLRQRNRQPADTSLARSTLADFDWVIARGRDIGPMRVTVANAAYLAGLASQAFLGSAPQAYEYWNRCALRDHAGCMYLIAAAKVTGDGGLAVDLPGALELHKKVYDTGTAFICAGAYSALAAAQILYFSGAQQLTVGDLDWIKRGDLLLDELVKERKWANPCTRARFMMTEYLMRLDRGDERRGLLESAVKIAEGPEEKATAGYLLGNVSEADFLAAARKAGDLETACDMHFDAYWHAEIRKDGGRAERHYDALSKLAPPNGCAMERALVKLKYRR
jgi:hypothetical protein